MNKKKLTPANYKSILNGIKWLGKTSKTAFSYLAGVNRPIYPHQVTKLCKSLEMMGILRCIVIAELDFINGKMTKYIIDGQHLFNALIRLGWDIPYVTIKIKNKVELVETIAMLNASSKTWSQLDYITAWSSLIPDYVKLNHYYEVYDLDLGFLASVFSGNATDGGNITKKIKSGEFRIVNEENNVEVLNQLTDVLKIIPRMNRFENRYVCKEYVKFVRSAKKYNHVKFMENLKKKKELFILATQENGKLYELFTKICLN